LFFALLLLGTGISVGCEGTQPSFPDASPPANDASSPDAGDLPCSAEDSQTYYADFDGDGYGSPELTAVDCTVPDRFIDNNLDCDDGDTRVNPDGIELCDGLDNDCNAATAETCLNACTPQVRDTEVYLFCAGQVTYSVAKTACVAEGMHLIRIDDLVEQNWMSAQRTPAFGAPARVWMGGNDANAEGVWVWHDDLQFWQGGAGGAAPVGVFSHWRGGEPNNGDGVEDCGTVDDNAAGRWDDRPCNQVHRFICERDSEDLL
jgi:hypothetical protein